MTQKKVVMKKYRSRWITCALAALAVAGSVHCAYAADAGKRPNVLLAIGDDISWQHFGCYGSAFVETPVFDSLAQSGVKFNNAFCSAPGCSPSRAALLTGKHIWEIEEAGTHASNFPAHLQVYPEILQEQGYFIGYTGKPWGPGKYKINGSAVNPAGPGFNQKKTDANDLISKSISTIDYAANFNDFLAQRPKEKPFCFWFGAHEAHRRFDFKSGVKNGKKLEDAVVPGFLPDNETTRHEMLDYAIEVEWYDSHLGKMIEMLKEAGELENTLIVVTADNGMAFPRAKANNYEYGVHMPLIVSWPAKVSGNRAVNDPVSLIDLAPTFLEAAGIEAPEAMSGKSLLGILFSEKNGIVEPSREFVLSGRERHTHAREENLGYPVRAMHTIKYTYIRNLKPERSPTGQEYNDVDGSPSHSLMLEDKRSELSQLAYGPRPLEELYDRQNDPYCLNNLANNPEYRAVMDRMWQEMSADLAKAGDPRLLGYGDIWESYPRYSRMRDFAGFNESGKYNPEYVDKAVDQMKKVDVQNPAYEQRAKR